MTRTADFPVRIYEEDGTTVVADAQWLDVREMNDLDESEDREIREHGRVWVGGGASPLFLVQAIGAH